MIRRIETALRDERGRIVELVGTGWSAHPDDVLRDLEFAWNSYEVHVGGVSHSVGIVFGIAGRYLEAAGAPLDQVMFADEREEES